MSSNKIALRSDKLLLLIMKFRRDQQCYLTSSFQKERNYEFYKKLLKIYLLQKNREQPSKRSVWVRPILAVEKRLSQGFSNNLIQEMRLSDHQAFYDFFRMSVELFDQLLALVGPGITKQVYIRDPIPAKTRLEICIRYLATGDTMRSIANEFRVADNTVSLIVSETCDVIWDVLSDIVFPEINEEMWLQRAREYELMWDFPNCIGSIDGKHVTMQAPPDSGYANFIHKGSHSIVLLAVTDANGYFIMVDIGAEGRRSDGGIFSESDIGFGFENKEFNLPPPRTLCTNGTTFPYVLVADEAFSLTDYMMRPYPRCNLVNFEKKIFNYRLSRARRSVECSFGILVNRWRVLRTIINTSLETAIKIVQATTCLHNYVLKIDLSKPVAHRQYSRGDKSSNLPNSHSNDTNTSRADKIRDNFTTYFCKEGAVHFQWDKALRNNF